jgi:hypothetical protein
VPGIALRLDRPDRFAPARTSTSAHPRAYRSVRRLEAFPDTWWPNTSLPLALTNYGQGRRYGRNCFGQNQPVPSSLQITKNIACSARGRSDTRPGGNFPPNAIVQAKQMPRHSPTAAQPGGSRVAHCQGALPVHPFRMNGRPNGRVKPDGFTRPLDTELV